MKRFNLARRALSDLQEIWEFVSRDSLESADRLLEEFYQAFQQLAEMPGIGHRREDLTKRDLLFRSLHSFLIIYRDSTPINNVRIIHGRRDHGRRDVKKVLRGG